MISAIARSTAFRLTVTLAILAYLSTRVDMPAAAAAMAAATPSRLVAVLVLVALDRIVMIWRWWLLLDATQHTIGFGHAARVFLVSSFAGSFLPAGVGGDAARAFALARHTSRPHDAIASVGIDRVLGMMSIAMLGVLGALLWQTPQAEAVRQAVLAIGIVVTLGSAGLLWAEVLLDSLVPPRWRDRRWVRPFLRLARAAGRYRAHPSTLLAVLIWSLVVQLLRVGQAYYLGSSLGMTVPFTYYLVFMPVGLLMLLLPISVSGFGLPQGVIVWLLEPLGVPAPEAFALSTLIILSGLAGNLPGAWLYLVHKTK